MEVEDFIAAMLDLGFNPRSRSPKEDRWHLDLPKLTRNTDYLKLES